jgi:hypothetical protein
MPSDLRSIIDEIASQADDFLAGVTDRTQARAGVEELVTMKYLGLLPEERSVVVTGVMSALEDEEFFGTEFVGDAFSDDEERDED